MSKSFLIHSIKQGRSFFQFTRIGSARCCGLDDRRPYIDSLLAQQCLEICANLQDDELGHSHFREVSVQQCSEVLKFQMGLRPLQHLQRSLRHDSSRCPDLGRHFAALRNCIGYAVKSRFLEYHLNLEIVLFDLPLYCNNQYGLRPPEKTVKAHFIYSLALLLYHNTHMIFQKDKKSDYVTSAGMCLATYALLYFPFRIE